MSEIRKKLPLLSSPNKAVRIAGYISYAFVMLLVLVALSNGNEKTSDGVISENAVKNAIYPWGDDDFVIFENRVTVSVDITDPEDRDIAYPFLFEHLFALPEVGQVTIAGYLKDDSGHKEYNDSARETLSRAEWEKRTE